jgi:hypothetical protein
MRPHERRRVHGRKGVRRRVLQVTPHAERVARSVTRRVGRSRTRR